jgi:peptidoglycan hydrolase FlgJ
MTAQGTTPLSNPAISGEDFATRLVRVPRAQASTVEKVGNSFNKVLSGTLHAGEATASAGRAKQDKRLWDACVEMESILVGKMLKEMRKSVHKSGLMDGGFAEEIFEDMLYDEYAMSLSRNSNLGMAKMLYNELNRKA